MELKEQLFGIIKSLEGFTPEIFLSAAFILLIIAELILYKFHSKNISQFWLYGLTLAILALSFHQVTEQFYNTSDGFLFHEMLFLDAKAIFFKCLVSMAAIILLAHSWVLKKSFPGEFFPILTGILIGLYLMTMSVNLIMIYLSIEIVSIGSYIFTAINRDKTGSEGGLKYIIFGAASSAIMLYGMSLLYGITGTLSIVSPDFSRNLAQVDNITFLVAATLTLSGFLFKLSATPFHIWTPDVYESAPTPIVAFFSIAPKAASFLIAMRFLEALPAKFQLLMAVIALATITIGNFSALWQQNAKRMLAYSTIAHSGFMLIGLVTLSELGIKSIVFYLVTYLFANFAAFLLLDIADASTGNNGNLKIFRGLGLKNPFYGILLVIVMISLTGLPPTAGFFAKLNIFSALWESYQTSQNQILLWLFIFGLFNTVVSLFFYLKIPFVLFFKKGEVSENNPFKITFEQQFLAIILVLPILLLFFKADLLMNLIALL